MPGVARVPHVPELTYSTRRGGHVLSTNLRSLGDGTRSHRCPSLAVFASSGAASSKHTHGSHAQSAPVFTLRAILEPISVPQTRKPRRLASSNVLTVPIWSRLTRKVVKLAV